MSGDWSENTILLFLEAYQMEECIWNPDHHNYKDRKKVHEAWVRLSQIMDSSVKDLKHKKEILMTTFRRHLKKKKESILSGEGPEKMYKPLWFAYDQMESFLAQVYTDKYTVKTEKVQKQSHKTEDTDEEDSKVHTKYVTSRRRRRPSSDQEETLTSYRRSSNHYSREEPPPREEDDVDLYSRLLAKKLREFSPDERKLLMYEIDTIIINKFKNRLQRRRTPSPRFLDMNSS